MAAKGTTYKHDDDEDQVKMSKADKATLIHDPMDPANQPGSTGNAGAPSAGIKRMPSSEEDDAAKEQAAKASLTADDLLGEGSYRKAAQVEAKAITEGASVLGKEAVVTQNDQGTPVVSRRGLDPEAHKASATNPALVANNAVPLAGASTDEVTKVQDEADAAAEDKDHKGPIPAAVTDLHGKGAAPHVG